MLVFKLPYGKESKQCECVLCFDICTCLVAYLEFEFYFIELFKIILHYICKA